MKLLSKKLMSLLVWMVVLMLPVVSMAQPDVPIEGASPDETLNNPVVPFDSTMNLLFLAVAIVFAVVMFKKLQHRKAAGETKA